MSQAAVPHHARTKLKWLLPFLLLLAPWFQHPADETDRVLAYTVAGSLAPGEAVIGTPAADASIGEVFVGQPPAPLRFGSSPTETTPRSSARDVEALALQRVGYQLPGWAIEFKAALPQLRGLTFADQQRIEIYVHTDNVAVLARVVAHELGHAADITFNNTGSRRRWEAARGIGDTVPWWPTPGHADFSTGSGDFAECFASWRVGSASRSDFGSCSAEDLDLLVSLVVG